MVESLRKKKGDKEGKKEKGEKEGKGEKKGKGGEASDEKTAKDKPDSMETDAAVDKVSNRLIVLSH